MNKELKDSERQRCEIFVRVMGYYQNLSRFNKGKKKEYNEREFYKSSKAED